MSLARVATIKRTPQELGVAIETWAHEWQPLAAAQGVTLQLEGLTALGQAMFHANTLRRVVLNLVHNALDAMPQGARLPWPARAWRPRCSCMCGTPKTASLPRSCPIFSSV